MNFSFGEMFFIFILALIIFGPKRLPEIGRQIGKALAEFKRYSNDFKYQLESEVRQWEIEDKLNKEKEKETLAPSIQAEEEKSSAPEGTIAADPLDAFYGYAEPEPAEPESGAAKTAPAAADGDATKAEAPVTATPGTETPAPEQASAPHPPTHATKESNA